MRLAWVAVALVLYTAFLIHRAMPQLPERVPTHFNFQGQPTGWSSPDVLWTMLLAQVVGAGLLLAIPWIGRRAPQLVNLGRRRLSDFPPEARARIMPLLEDMSAWMTVLFCLFFTLLIRGLIRAALDPTQSPSLWLVAGFVAVMGLVVVYYLRQFDHVAQKGDTPGPPKG